MSYECRRVEMFVFTSGTLYDSQKYHEYFQYLVQVHLMEHQVTDTRRCLSIRLRQTSTQNIPKIGILLCSRSGRWYYELFSPQRVLSETC